MAAPSFIQANTAGRLHDAREPSVSPLDRGFLYGDAVYEVCRTYGGVLFAWDEHWDRLERSAASLAMDLGHDKTFYLSEIRKTTAAFRAARPEVAELYVRLQVSRGAGPIGLTPSLADRAGYVILVQELVDAAPAALDHGLRLATPARFRRNAPQALDPAWKTGNYLNNIQCLREALAAGADEALILNQAGFVTEGTVRNVFFVNDSGFFTPPLSDGLLPGITRDLLLTAVDTSGLPPPVERSLRPSDLTEFTEAFVTSTTQDVFPVSSLDGRAFPTRGGTLTRRLKERFRAYVAKRLAGEQHLRV